MSHRIHILAFAFIFASVSLFSQTQSDSELLHPEVQRYADHLDLTEEQTNALQAVYVETAEKGKELDKQMVEERRSREDDLQNATPSEKEQYRSDMNAFGKARLQLKQERADKLEELLTPEQKKVLQESRSSRPKG